jgi:adenosylhomocysteine nucleosidase
MTRVGPVEAAVAITADYLARLKASRTALPDLVVSLGSAGSRTLEQTGIYQAVVGQSYRDMDATALGFPQGPNAVPRPAGGSLATVAHPGIREATLSTGANMWSRAPPTTPW